MLDWVNPITSIRGGGRFVVFQLRVLDKHSPKHSVLIIAGVYSDYRTLVRQVSKIGQSKNTRILQRALTITANDQ